MNRSNKRLLGGICASLMVFSAYTTTTFAAGSQGELFGGRCQQNGNGRNAGQEQTNNASQNVPSDNNVSDNREKMPQQDMQSPVQTKGSDNHTQPQELINEGFNDNGQIDKQLPQVKGNDSNPVPDQDTIDEITKEGGLSQSEDYSYVYLLGDVSDSDYETFKVYLEAVYDDSSATVDALESEGWEIILTSEDLDMLLFGGSTQNVAGCTVFSDKTIYVEAGEYEYCVVHEIGHFLDYEEGFLSKQSDFTSIYESEGSNLTEYGATSATEFFAEVFMYGILEESTTAEKVPEAYSYVEAVKEAF